MIEVNFEKCILITNFFSIFFYLTQILFSRPNYFWHDTLLYSEFIHHETCLLSKCIMILYWYCLTIQGNLILALFFTSPDIASVGVIFIRSFVLPSFKYGVFPRYVYISVFSFHFDVSQCTVIMHGLNLVLTVIFFSASSTVSNSLSSDKKPHAPNDLVVPCSDSDPDPWFLLPPVMRPLHYDVIVQPFLPPGNLSFHGCINILVRCEEPTNKITLHILNISIQEVTVRVKLVPEYRRLDVVRFTYDLRRERFTIHLCQVIKALEEFNVSLYYQGFLNNDMRGFYRSSFPDDTGNDTWALEFLFILFVQLFLLQLKVFSLVLCYVPPPVCCSLYLN